MKILSIDTSCDDTAVSVIEARNSLDGKRTPRRVAFEIRNNIVSSQMKLHAKYGGVYPFLAKREHIKNLPLVFRRATKGIKLSEIDLIGVTNGPGLEPCLWQGINFAKELAEKFKRPLVPVNHIEAHILSNYIERNEDSVKLPAVCLVVSGGHTSLFFMEKIGKYELIGETQDDAAGECFDKTARILGLGYPGGPAIAAEAAKYKIQNIRHKTQIQLPRPMIHQKNYDFSFSGLKTAVLYNYKSQSPEMKRNKEYIRAMSFEIQQAIIDVLLRKTLKAAKDYKVKTVMLGGGVAANNELRKQFEKGLPSHGFDFLVPSKDFCTDNAVMIGVAAFFNRANKAKNLKSIKAKGNLAI